RGGAAAGSHVAKRVLEGNEERDAEAERGEEVAWEPAAQAKGVYLGLRRGLTAQTIARSIQPPRSTRPPSYNTTARPGVTALSRREAETLALTDGEAFDAVVLREHMTRGIDDDARCRSLWPALADQGRMIAAGYETNLDTVRLVRYAEVRLSRQRPHFVLAIA